MTKPAALTLKAQIEQELTKLDARAAELRTALKVVSEFEDVVEVKETASEEEPKRIILKPTDNVPDAVKSRLADGAETGRKLADRTFDLERT